MDLISCSLLTRRVPRCDCPCPLEQSPITTSSTSLLLNRKNPPAAAHSARLFVRPFPKGIRKSACMLFLTFGSLSRVFTCTPQRCSTAASAPRVPWSVGNYCGRICTRFASSSLFICTEAAWFSVPEPHGVSISKSTVTETKEQHGSCFSAVAVHYAPFAEAMISMNTTITIAKDLQITQCFYVRLRRKKIVSIHAACLQNHASPEQKNDGSEYRRTGPESTKKPQEKNS